MTDVSTHSVEAPGAAGQPGRSGTDDPVIRRGPVGPAGPVEWLMSTVIRKLAWSRLADPKVAITVSGAGLLLGMLVGAMAPNAETLPIRLPLSSLLPSLAHHVVLASVML